MVTNSRNHLIFPAPMAVPVQGQLWRRKEEDKVRTYGCASGWKWSRKCPSHWRWPTLWTQIKHMQRNSKAKTQRNHACKQPKPSHISCSNSSSCPGTAMAKKGGRQSYKFWLSYKWILNPLALVWLTYDRNPPQQLRTPCQTELWVVGMSWLDRSNSNLFRPPVVLNVGKVFQDYWRQPWPKKNTLKISLCCRI